MICRACNKDVPRFIAEKKKRQRGFHYRDDKGKLWSGRKCYSCWHVELKTAYQETFNTGPKKDQVEGRMCRSCKKQLPANKYFYHDLCMTVEVPYGVDEYGGYCAFGGGF